MQPTVAQLSGLDVYRDGGSLSASFFDLEKIEHTLMFPVRFSDQEPSGSKQRNYFPPVLERFIPVDRVSPITGITDRDWNKKSEPLSWQQAIAILAAMQPLIATFQTEYAWVYPEMVEIAKAGGHLA
jgi:hypothetical protein